MPSGIGRVGALITSVGPDGRSPINGTYLYPRNLVNGVDLSRFRTLRWPYRDSVAVLITLNGERFELDRPMTVLDLLARLEIDPRRVAIEHNLEIIKRRTFESAVVHEGDRVEIVNAVGGG
jgi:sulfur carrier protein